MGYSNDPRDLFLWQVPALDQDDYLSVPALVVGPHRFTPFMAGVICIPLGRSMA